MPELHANQIRWEAPEPQKASFDKPNYMPLADAFTRLGAVADEIGQRQRDLLDDDLKADLKLAEDEANQIIENAASADADYDQLSEMMLSKVQGAFYKYDEATRTRFTRENKTYFDELQLAVTEKILQKKSKQLINEVKINIPLWASEAVSKGTWEAREEGINKIQSSLKGLASPDQIASLTYEYNNMIDRANVNNLIVAGTDEALAEAKTFVTNPKKAASLDPYERSVLLGRIYAQEAENMKAKATKETPEMTNILREYGRYSIAGNTPAAKIVKQILFDGGYIPYEVGQDENGQPIYDFVDASLLSPEQVLKLHNEFKKFDDANPNYARDVSNFSNEATEVLLQYEKGKKEKTSDLASSAIRARELLTNDLFKELPQGTRDSIEGVYTQQIRARAETARGAPEQMMVYSFPLIYRTAIGNPAAQTAQLLASGDYLVGTTHVNVGENTVDATTRFLQDNGLIKAPEMSPVPYDVKGASPTKYTSGVQVDEGGFFGSEETYKPYQRSLSNSIVGATKRYTKEYMSDSIPNSLSMLGAFNHTTLLGMKRSGQLQETRFGKMSDTYIEQKFTEWTDALKQKGQYNMPVLKVGDSAIRDFYKSLMVDGKFSDEENIAVTQMEQIARETFDGNEESPIINAYNVATRGMVKSGAVSDLSGSNYHKANDVMQSVLSVKIPTKVQSVVKKGTANE